MSILSDIKTFDSRGILLVGAAFLGLLIPGFLTLYAFDRELFLKADILKLSILSACITAPSFVTLFVTTLIGERVFTEMAPQTTGRFGGFKDWLVTHSFSNASIFFAALLIHLVVRLSLKAFLTWVVVLLIAYVGFEFYRLVLLAKGLTKPHFHDPGNKS